MTRPAKDMSVLREAAGFREAMKLTQAPIKDYGLGQKVVIQWDLNQDAIRDRVFKLVIDDEIEIFIDLEELLNYTRLV